MVTILRFPRLASCKGFMHRAVFIHQLTDSQTQQIGNPQRRIDPRDEEQQVPVAISSFELIV